MPDLEDLLIRFEATALNATIYESNEDDFYHRGLTVTVPRGTSSQRVMIGDGDVDAVGDAPIEHFSYVEGYDAIWSPNLHRAECRLTLGRPWMRWDFALHHHRRSYPSGQPVSAAQEVAGLPTIPLVSPDPGLVATIQPASRPHQLLCGQRIGGTRVVASALGQTIGPTLVITGPLITDHDSALNILDSLGAALLFDLDQAFDVPIYLSPDPGDIHMDLGTLTVETGPAPPPPPQRAYSKQALTLYWAGRSLEDNPLLQYLAYYQVLEYFFPRYALSTAIDRARGVLLSGTFNAADHANMEALVTSVSWPKDEKHSLRLVLENGVTDARLRRFLNAKPSRTAFFTSDTAKRLTQNTIEVNGGQIQPCALASRRIYALRCRIVHTKGSGTKEPPLLPFSSEIHGLRQDLELVEFVAREVLISTSSPLRLTP